MNNVITSQDRLKAPERPVRSLPLNSGNKYAALNTENDGLSFADETRADSVESNHEDRDVAPLRDIPANEHLDLSREDSPRLIAEPTPEEIAELAYYIWDEDGRPHGRQDENWLEAERFLRLAASSAGQESVVQAG